MGPSVAAGAWNASLFERKSGGGFRPPRTGHPTPQRGGVGLGRIAVPQEQVQLMRIQA